jgi:hypothetical protein
MMVSKPKIRRALRFAVAITAMPFFLAGCVGSPTYGTGTPADEQLLKDVTGVFDITPQRNAQIDYKPRPEIVKTADTSTLPPPQDSVASISNPNWPESPEQMRARLRADATANRENPNYRPGVTDSRQEDVAAPETDPRNPRIVDYTGKGNSSPVSPRITSAAAYDRIPGNHEPTTDNAREEFNRRLAEQKQGSPTQRRYLSEPPLDYRVPADTAPVNDIGVDEWKKEKRQKAEARKKSGESSWRDLVPWL